MGAVRQKLSTDPFQHYVLCLDPATGRILWSTYVASGGTEINLFGNSTRESLGSPVAVALATTDERRPRRARLRELGCWLAVPLLAIVAARAR